MGGEFHSTSAAFEKKDNSLLTPADQIVVGNGGGGLEGSADEAVQVESLQKHPEERARPEIACGEVQDFTAHLHAKQ
jgi:hypothetical protein